MNLGEGEQTFIRSLTFLSQPLSLLPFPAHFVAQFANLDSKISTIHSLQQKDPNNNMFGALLATLFLLGLLFIALYNCFFKRKGLPPGLLHQNANIPSDPPDGPMPLPFFGNTLALMKRQPGEDVFLEWRQQFGNIFTFWLGETPIVCIAEYGKMVEYYQRGGEPFAGRHAVEAYERIIRGGILGVLQTEGDTWRELRRFTLHVFRNFGVGKNLQQERILTEIGAMFKHLESDLSARGNGEIDIVRHFERAISSIINALLVGFRFDEEHDELYHRLNNQLWRFNNRMQHLATNLFMWKPDWFKSMPLCRNAYALVKQTHDLFFGFFDDQIRHHQKILEEAPDLNTPSVDFVEAFLKEKLKRERAGEETGEYTLDHLKATLFDLWISGQETTTTALAWGVAYMVHNAEVMDKIHAELDRVIGCDQQLITWADRINLPYTSAAVNEVLRVGNVVAQDFPHRMMQDTPVDGWILRRGQPIVAQISVVLMDPTIFPNPKAFRPERYLDDRGNVRKIDELIPFALGKRQCLGESLARMEMFLFFANILNRYKILAGQQMPSLERKMGVPVLCPKFTCRVEKRH